MATTAANTFLTAINTSTRNEAAGPRIVATFDEQRACVEVVSEWPDGASDRQYRGRNAAEAANAARQLLAVWRANGIIESADAAIAIGDGSWIDDVLGDQPLAERAAAWRAARDLEAVYSAAAQHDSSVVGMLLGDED